MRLSLRTKISIGLCTMLGVLVLSVMILVNRVTTRAIEGKIRRDLVAARAVFERFQQWRFQELLTSTTMLVDIPHLKAVITTPGLDHATLLDSAQAARELVHSDLLVLSDAQGSLLASVTETDCGVSNAVTVGTAEIVSVSGPAVAMWPLKARAVKGPARRTAAGTRRRRNFMAR